MRVEHRGGVRAQLIPPERKPWKCWVFRVFVVKVYYYWNTKL